MVLITGCGIDRTDLLQDSYLNPKTKTLNPSSSSTASGQVGGVTAQVVRPGRFFFGGVKVQGSGFRVQGLGGSVRNVWESLQTGGCL